MKEVFHQTPPSPIPSVLAHIKEWEIFSYFFLSCHYMFFCNKGICYFVSSLFVFASKRMAGTDKWEGKAIWCKNATGRSYQLRFSWSRPSKNHPSIAMGNTTKYIHFILLRMDWLGLAWRFCPRGSEDLAKMIITLHLGWLPQDFLEPGHLLVAIPSCVIGSADGDDSALLAKWFMISSHDLVDHNCKENQTVLLSNATTHKSPYYCK